MASVSRAMRCAAVALLSTLVLTACRGSAAAPAPAPTAQSNATGGSPVTTSHSSQASPGSDSSPGSASGPSGTVSSSVGATMKSSASATGVSSPPATTTRTMPTLRNVGSVTFTADTGRAATGTVGGAKAAVVKATSADGTVWTLTVPAGALPAAQRVTLTPMASVGGNATLAPKSGVVFAPDGLRFASPAILSVSGPDAATYLYLGSAKGADLRAAGGTEDANSFVIPHFSVGVTSPTPPVDGISRDPDQAAGDLRTDLDLLLQNAKDDDVTPTLPSGTLSGCGTNAVPGSLLAPASSAIDGDGQDAVAIASAEVMAYTPHIDPDRRSGMWDMVHQIDKAWAQANARRIIRVIKGYDDQPEHAPQQLFLVREVIAVTDYDPSAAPVDAAIKAWSDNVAFALVERVQSDHEYEMIPLVLQLGAAQDDSGRGVTSSIADALHKALRFKETFDYTVSAPQGTYHAKLTGTAQVSSGVATTEMSGTGDGTYVSGSLGGGQGTVTPGQAWSTSITINLHPCDHTAEFSADAYGTPEEVTVHGITVVSPLSGMDNSMQDALRYLSGGNFLTGTLTNKQATTTTHKSWSGGGAQMTATLTLTHDPEQWTAPPPESIP